MFRHLRIHNFLSIGDVDLPLENLGLVLIEGQNGCNFGTDSNGSGKSSLFEALLWGLYEETVRGFSKDEVIRSGSTDGCLVEIQFGDYWIRRSRKHSTYGTGFWVFENGHEIVNSSGKGSERALVKEIVGLDCSGFLYTMMMGQGATKLLSEASDKEQKSLYEAIILAADFPSIQERIAEDCTKLRTEIYGLTSSVQAWTLALSGLETRRVEVVRSAEEWERSRVTELSSRNSRIILLQSRCFELENSKLDTERLIQAGRTMEQDLRSNISSSRLFLSQIESRKLQISSAKRDQERLLGDLNRLEKIVSELAEFRSAGHTLVADRDKSYSKYQEFLAEKEQLSKVLEEAREQLVSLQSAYSQAVAEENDLKIRQSKLESENQARIKNAERCLREEKHKIEDFELRIQNPGISIGTECPVCFQPITESSLGGYADHLRKELEESRKVVEFHENELKKGIPPCLVEIGKEMFSATMKVGNSQCAVESHKKVIKGLAEKLSTHNSQEPEIQQTYSRAYSAASINETRISSLLEEQVRVEASIASFTTPRLSPEDLQKIDQEYVQLVSEEAKRKQEIIQQESTLAQLSGKLAEFSKVYSKVSSDLTEAQKILRTEEDGLLAFTNQTNPHSVGVLDLEISSKKEEVAKARQELISKESLLQHIEFLWEMFGDKGLKSYLMDFIVAPLNSAAAFYSNLLTGGEIQVEFSTVKHLKNGNVRENFNIQVFNRSGSPVYSGNSGGEKKKANIIILQAVRKVLRDRANFKINCGFYDEFDGALDRSGKELIFRLMEQEAEALGTVFVITHDESWKARFQESGKRVLTVVKDTNGITRTERNW